MEKLTLKVKRLNKRVEKPEMSSTGAVQFRAGANVTIPGNSTKRIPTGMAVEIPEGHYGFVIDDTHLLNNYPLHIRPTIISWEDREEIILTVFNYTNYPEKIITNQFLAAMILMPIISTDIKLVGQLKKVVPTKEE